eukprot:UN20149
MMVIQSVYCDHVVGGTCPDNTMEITIHSTGVSYCECRATGERTT